MQNKYTTTAFLIMSGLLAFSAQAQDASRVAARVLSPDGTPELISFRPEKAYALTQAPQMLREQLGLSPEDQLRATTADTDQLGFQHQKFQQFYKGVKVEHATYSVHARQGKVETISGHVEKLSGLSTTPALSEARALESALAFVGASRYMWQDAEEETELKASRNDASATYRPQGELVIVRNQRTKTDSGNDLVLAYKFDVYAQQPVSRAYIYVDARTGAIVATDAIIKHAGAVGSFATAYNGTRSFANETVTAGQFRLRETTRGLGIETYNMKKGTQYSRAVDFVDADNNWTAAEYNNANFDNTAGDAHVGAQATYDYWKTIHGRNSFDNAGAKIKSYVHYGRSYENAYWNGSVMTYGDGAARFRPLTSLDVCAHEIGHAVCEKTANLTYSNESGAMNEGLSDIWGASVEDYAVSTLGFTSGGPEAKSTWLIGEEIDKQQVALRSMSDPNSLNQPAYYKGLKWYTGTGDNGGVHTNSGVLNYWFYLISVGKTGTNEKGAAFSVAGLGLDAAAKITFRMESVYMTASSTYAQARTYSIQAATDLYGAGSAQVNAVTNAWYAVGIGTAATAAVAPASGSTTTAASLTGGISPEFSVFPVPASNELYLKLGTNAPITNVQVTDLRGATMAGAVYDGNGTLDISSLAKGMYLITTIDGQHAYRQRFVKQ
jgi:Zn-dependent metalloprotease